MSINLSNVSYHRYEVRSRIENLIVQIIISILENEDPTLDILDFPQGLFSKSNQTEERNNNSIVGGGYSVAKDLASLLKLLSTSYEILGKHKTITQRELYYIHATYFSSQAESNNAISRAMQAIQVPRHALGILAAGRGWFAGRLKVHEDQTTVVHNGVDWDLSESNGAMYSSARKGPARPIPSDCVFEPMIIAADGARFILVVEKECIFRRLYDDRIWEHEGMDCIIVTGCGFPDLATRAFVHQLHECLQIPILGLSDWNPFGLGIMLCYRDGSASNPESHKYKVPLKWIGMKYDDLEAFNIPDTSLQVMSNVDEKKVLSYLRSGILRNDPDMFYECERWFEVRRKMEIEGIMCHGMEFLVDCYLATKIRDELEGAVGDIISRQPKGFLGDADLWDTVEINEMDTFHF